MIEQQGQAVSRSGNKVTVRLGGKSGCAACDAGRGCGAGVFGKLLRRRAVELEFDNHIGARCGQAVIVGVPEGLFLGLVVQFYLLPLLAGLAGAVIGHYLAGIFGAGAAASDLLALLAGLGGGAAALLRVRRRPTEFPQGFAVHLLRMAEPSALEEEKEVIS